MTRLVWEEDSRRAGMKRRGSAKRAKGQSNESSTSPKNPPMPNSQHTDALINDTEGVDAKSSGAGDNSGAASVPVECCQSFAPPPPVEQLTVYQRLPFPHSLGSTESYLLDHYIGRFSRTYPTFSGPSNPFLSVLLPIAMQNRMVLDSLLTLSGARIWDGGWSSMEIETLKLRQRALSGCRKLLQRYNSNQRSVIEFTTDGKASMTQPTQQCPTATPAQNPDATDLLYLLTSSALFLLYEMITGDSCFKPHLNFTAQIFQKHSLTFNEEARKHPAEFEAFQFLHNLFLYNDLVMSTSLRVPTASDFYMRASSRRSDNLYPTVQDKQSRYYFPSLMARISALDTTVTEDDIEAWDGRLDWLPSFSLAEFQDSGVPNPISTGQENATGCSGALAEKEKPCCNDREIISKLYRVTAHIYRRQSFSTHGNAVTSIENMDSTSSTSLASSAIQLIQQLSEGSMFESTLLWPIGICGRELMGYHIWERHYVICRLQQLKQRFRMKHFQRAQEVLENFWCRKDREAMHGSVTASCWRKESVMDLILLG